MGDPIRLRKKYVTPPHPWQKQRIADEKKLLKEFGLKSKTELLKAEAELRKYRKLARQLIGIRGAEAEKKKKILIDKLARIGLLPLSANLDDVLSLELRDFLERRMQTIVYKKGFANTLKEARQVILHGFVSLHGAKHTAPGTLIPKSEEDDIAYIGPARAKPRTDAEAEPILEKQPVQNEIKAEGHVEVE